MISPGGLPKGMTLSDLGRKSIRRNALIADLLHRIDFIEKAGTGIRRIRDEVREQGCPEPEFETNGFFTAIFRPNPDVRAEVESHIEDQSGHRRDQVTLEVAAHDEAHDEAHEPMTEIELKLLSACAQNPKNSPDLLLIIGYRSRTGNFKKALSRLLSQRLLEMTNPQKPRAKNQRYRITLRGREMLEKHPSFSG